MEDNRQENLINILSEEKSKIAFIDPVEEKKKEQEKLKMLIFVNKGKIISLVVAIFNLITGALIGGGEGFLGMLLYGAIIPLFLIWSADYVSGHEGSSWGFGGSTVRRINAPTPAFFIRMAGWIMLFYPYIKVIFGAIFLIS